ncbi:MAG: M14 family zinc carboxypeptidase [Cyanobacteriota bacterium]|nr:M14 family zinc carboxypeptidase [Cyanobacteriota bacterium]
MNWTDLKQLDRLIRETEALGAEVEEIGVSGEGRSLYGVTIGDREANRTIALVAGCHADEIISPLTAISMVRRLVRQPLPGVKFSIVPVADPDFLDRNARDLPKNATLRDLLGLNRSRDLEGNFTADIYPECVAIRQWMQKLDRVDAYFSLHSAGCIAPGLFFYVGCGTNLHCVHRVYCGIRAVLPEDILLLSRDPTGLSQHRLSPGFFELALPPFPASTSNHPGSSLTYVSHHFQPQFVGASEMPLAVCPALKEASLSEIEECNREFVRTGRIRYPFREIPLKTQVAILQTAIESVARWISQT